MTSFLPNPFQDSGAHVPEASDEAGASAPAPTPDAPAALSSSCSDAEKPCLQGEEAAVGAIPAASDISDIPEIFRVANLLCVEAREFIPDYPGIYQAMMDENAPRAFESDEVWSDLAPLFLQNVKA